ncbi:hook-length control protein FliK [Variovorax sp. YR266]|uniref:flagellar hook-length control protein FliK n=1 Tax=Variovorax sp. YR266 TaxID=1884386 RepID=UPI000899C696|nr:flagellar hook-length control protein FliK [Variovorax sp. YR266]SDZ68051.1 hook-length control protein FliK [Variovorax sp. YR266]
MTALAGLLDALLAARLAPRLDVLGIKAEAVIGAPGPAMPVGKVDNDVRLPSNAALDRQLPGAMAGGTAHAGAGATPSVAMRLSVAARVIGAVLADLQAQPGPVRGAAPLLSSRGQPASAAALAGALAQTVSDSGLFYESHLAEFAAGSRTLAQMAQEPQARWSAPVAARPDVAALAAAVAVVAQAPASATSVGVSGVSPALLVQAMVVSVPQGDAFRTVENAPVPQVPATDAQPQEAARSAQDPAHVSGQAVSNDAARVQAAYRQPESAQVGGMLDSMPAHRAGDSARQADGAAAVSASRGAEVIHPQAVTIVHQQLDLLASAVFRWSGQAWPDVPMSWSIEEEQAQQRDGAAAEEEGTRRWSTTVSLALPRLGEVDLRLSLDGSAVQAHLFARETATMARLRGDTGRLAKRFDAAGLRLQQVQVMAKAAA